MLHRLVAVLAALVIATGAATAYAQEPAPPGGEFRAPFTRPGESLRRNETTWSLQTGGAFSVGNSMAVAAHGGTRLILRRRDDQLTVTGVVIYGYGAGEPERTAAGTTRSFATIQDEFYARARYDRFFAANNAVFAGAVAFSDRSAGIAARWIQRVGYLRVIAAVPSRLKFWGEAGYDLASEHLVPRFEGMQGASSDVPAQRWVHLARAFLGVSAAPMRTLEFEVGGEVSFDLLDAADWRAGGAAAVSAKISEWFRLGVYSTARYLHEPIDGRQPFDFSTQAVLILRLSDRPESATGAASQQATASR